MLCLGNKQISPTLITEVGAYGDDLNALNLTGATLNVDDKVWLSPMYLGNEADVNQFGNNGSQYSFDPVVVSRDGSVVYSAYNGILFNTSTKTSTSTSQTYDPSGYSGVVKYADNGMIWSYNNKSYNASYKYWISVGGNSYGTSTQYAYVGGDYYYDAVNSQFVKMDTGTMNVIKTYTDNTSVGSFTYVALCGLSFCYANGYIYYKSSNPRIWRAIVNDEDGTITDDALMLDNTSSTFVLPYVTSDGKYFLSYQTSTNSNSGNYFRIYTLVNNTLREVSNINELSPDLLPFYNNTYTTCVYNQQDDILVIANSLTREIAVFKYSNDKFIKIGGYIDTTTSDALYSIFATASSDGTIIGYHCGRLSVNGLKPTIVQLQGDAEYKVINYQNVNISTASLTGYITKGGANGELIQVKTILPPKLNVSVTVNANDAIITGGVN